MRRLIIGFLLLSLCGCGVVDYFSRKVVARAGDQVLTTDWFAEMGERRGVRISPSTERHTCGRSTICETRCSGGP
jgi:hypothetical protein